MKNIFITILSLFFLGLELSAKPFTIVIDPGHGGKDPGAIGAFSKEKDINLAIALLLGKEINAYDSQIKVIYTRDCDKTVELIERTRIANKADANLFLSIHTNAAQNKSAMGTETFTLGLARSEENLEVAKRENAVILLEDNYNEKYEGFDPNSADSYIMFEFMQDRYLNQSLSFASNIQSRYTSNSDRYDRGVRQAGFLVLRTASMPSVLTEVGYITNAAEEKYLNSKEGRASLAHSLFLAFKAYKNEYDKKNKIATATTQPVATPKVDATKPVTTNTKTETGEATPSTPKEETNVGSSTKVEVVVNNNTPQTNSEPVKTNNETIVFKVQFLTSKNQLDRNSTTFKNLQNVECYFENDLYKYTYGNSTSLEEITKLKREICVYYPDAFLVAFCNGKKISISEALNRIKQ